MKNPKVKASKIQAGTSELPAEELKPDREASTEGQKFIRVNPKPKGRFSKVTDEIAQSDHWMRNEPIPFGLELFKVEQNLWFLRYADLCYPYAKGGPIYIDTPGNSTDVMFCERKLKAYRSKGVRYTYLKAQESATEALMRLHQDLPEGTVKVDSKEASA